MTGPIETAIHQIDPSYVITDEDRDEIAAAENPVQVAAWLSAYVQSWRENFAKQVEPPCDPRLISMAVAIRAANLSQAVRSEHGKVSTLMAGLGRHGVFGLGRMVGQQEGDLIRAAFLSAYGRPIKAGGYEYYREQMMGVDADYPGGRPLPAIIAEIEQHRQERE